MIADFNNILAENLIEQALKYHSQGNTLEASKYYQFFLSKGFVNPTVLSNYAIILEQSGQTQNAIQLYRQSIEFFPSSTEAYSNLGKILKELGKLEEAEVYTRKAIKLNPNLAIAYSNLGGILNDLGKLEEAEVYTLKAIELNPNLATAHSNLGNIMRGLGRTEDAEISTHKAIKLNPNLAIAYSNLGGILIDLGKLKEAGISTHKAIELNPSLSIAYVNIGNIFKESGNLKDAKLHAIIAIQLNPIQADSYFNLGNILNDLGMLKQAEISTRKAIELNPRLADAYSNLGGILSDLGKLKEAEISIHKAIELNPDLAVAHYVLSLLGSSPLQNELSKHLFSEKILHRQDQKALINIYFARANVMHKDNDFQGSSNNLILANDMKIKMQPSNANYLLKKSKELLYESKHQKINYSKECIQPNCIFIVGMPRSGSTLLESIIGMNPGVYSLGEVNIFEEAFLEWKSHQHEAAKKNLGEVYIGKLNDHAQASKAATNKFLYNYQYAGIILNQVPTAKIIHCYRNPLDNILSIYRANFAHGNQYSSSLIDCARVYLDQDEIMAEYKKQYGSKIYSLNYDLLVSKTEAEVKSLISWLGWDWDDSYLTPHLNTRSVSTASSIQVRSPINPNSVESWKNYRKMLRPAIDLMIRIDKYSHLQN